MRTLPTFLRKKSKRKLSGRKERERDGTTLNSSFAALAGIKDVGAKIVRHTIARLTSVRGFSLIGLVYFSHCGKQTTSLNQSLIRGFFPIVLLFIPLRLVSHEIKPNVFEKNQVEISEQKERKWEEQSKTLLYPTLLELLQPKQCVIQKQD